MHLVSYQQVGGSKRTATSVSMIYFEDYCIAGARSCQTLSSFAFLSCAQRLHERQYFSSSINQKIVIIHKSKLAARSVTE